MGDPDSSYATRLLLLLLLYTIRWISVQGQRDKSAEARPRSLAFAGTFVGLCATGIAAQTFIHPLAQVLGRGAPASAAYVVSFLVVVLASAYILRLCDDIPKRLPAGKTTQFTRLIGWLFIPAGWLVQKGERGILRLLGRSPDSADEMTEEELRMLIDVGERDGTIEESEKAMLEGILELSDSTAAAMMTHRTEMTAIQRYSALSDVIEVALESGHSRIPVYEEDLDSIAGVLYVKDLLALVGEGKTRDDSFDLGPYLREPLYVLESTRAGTLLSEFKAKKIQLAIVIDEYGGTSGIVSMEDLLEEIVGNIQDEYDDEEEEIAQIRENEYLVDGLTDLDDVLKFFSLEDIEDEEEYDTIGGYVLGMQGGPLSDVGEPASLQIGHVRFTVQEMDRSRIAKLVAEVLPAEDDEDGIA